MTDVLLGVDIGTGSSKAVLTTESRKRRWRKFSKARELVTFDDARALVDKAERLLRKRT